VYDRVLLTCSLRKSTRQQLFEEAAGGEKP
jgi:hypothetical protein